MRAVPCKDCEHREVGCHSKCKEYKEFSEDMAEIRRKRFELSEYGRKEFIYCPNCGAKNGE